VQKKDRDFEGLAEKFRAIGHPVRLNILNLLCTCDRPRLTVKSIYQALQLDQPSASKHLNIMRKIGILERCREGVDTFYHLKINDPHIGCIKRCFV